MSGVVVPVVLVMVTGLIASVLLVIASHVFHVEVDERVSAVREVLPGANCGGCGYAGCDDYANAVVMDESTSCSKCSPGGAAVAEKIAEILGKNAAVGEKQVAQVMCNGDLQASKKILEWQGMQSCAGAKKFFSGMSACSFGCIGLGDCADACAFNAIGVVNGVAKVDKEACVACGMCVSRCPQKIIKLVPYKNQVHVLCSSTDKGAQARKNCDNACIGCGKCAKTCKFEAITVENSLASIDPSKCKNCGMCVKECPTGAINTYLERHIKKVAKKEAPAEKKDA